MHDVFIERLKTRPATTGFSFITDYADLIDGSKVTQKDFADLNMQEVVWNFYW